MASTQMKACKQCGQEILEIARKCRYCQSYQDPNDAPKQNFDLATIVISFVGVIATLGTIAAVVVGYFGFRSIGDISQRSTALLEKVDTKIKAFDSSVAKLSATVADLQQQATNVRRDLNGVAVAQRYDKFQQLFEYVQLDYAYNFPTQIQELAKIAAASAALQPIPTTAITYIDEMNALSQAIVQYRDALNDKDKDGFLAIVTLLEKVSDENLYKNRLLIGCYSHLNDIAFRVGNAGEASGYLDKQKHYALLALRAAERLNRTATIAKVNYAVTLIQGGDPQEMKKALALLVEARKDSPQIAGISYNIGVYYAKINQLDTALKNLEQAKNLGDFATCEDLRQWDQDSSFDLLRNTDVPEYKTRIEKLRQIGSAPC